MTRPDIHVLLVDNDNAFAKRLENTLGQDTAYEYSLTWKTGGDEGIDEAKRNPNIDVILIEYFLPDREGLDVIRGLHEANIRKPVVLVTKDKDFDIVLEMMKFGVRDCIVKEEISAAAIRKVFSDIYEADRRRDEPASQEISRQRVEAMRAFVSKFATGIEVPALMMKEIVSRWQSVSPDRECQRFLSIIGENVLRILAKIERLRSLNTDRTMRYIKNIRMIDLS